MQKDGKFDYSYTAPTSDERKEIMDIRRKYDNKYGEKNSLTKLKRLDRLVRRPALITSLLMGIGGLLIFGLGLSMTLEWNLLIWGSIVALIGLIPMGAAYWVYEKILARRKSKYADEILKLSNDLLGEECDDKDE